MKINPFEIIIIIFIILNFSPPFLNEILATPMLEGKALTAANNLSHVGQFRKLVKLRKRKYLLLLKLLMSLSRNTGNPATFRKV